MKFKIIIMICLSLFLGGTVSAEYRNATLDKVSVTVGDENMRKMFDNNTSTYYSFDVWGQRIYFSDVQRADNFYVLLTATRDGTTKYDFTFYLDGVSVGSIGRSFASSTANKVIDKEIKFLEFDEIKIISTGDVKIYEFDFWNDSEGKEFRDINVVAKERSAEVSWVLPDRALKSLTLAGKSLSTTATKYDFVNLKPDTEYVYNLSGNFESGSTTETIKFKTLADTTPPVNVTNLHAVQDGEAINLKYVIPNDGDLSHFEIWRNGVLLKDNVISSTYIDKNVVNDTTYTYKVVSVDTEGNKSVGINSPSVKFFYDLTPANVTNVKVIQNDKSVVLSYILPTDKNFKSISIYRNDTLLKDNITATTYTDTTVNYDTDYTYKVVSVNGEHKSSGVTTKLRVEAPKYSKDVVALKAITEQEKVSLSWENTTHEDFETVTIYRKEKESMMRSLFSSDNSTSLFETNGTVFNDLTVASDTAYTYTVTTTIANVESAGVSIDVTTPPASIVDGGVEPVDPSDPTSDYVVSWMLPTQGKVKIIVGGQDYKTVQASLQSYTIPRADMKYDFFGNPDVQIVPLDDTGGEIGTPVTPSPPGGTGTGGMLPGPEVLTGVLDAKEMVIAGIALFGLIAGFILLRLAFMFVPRMIKMIQQSNQKRVIK